MKGPSQSNRLEGSADYLGILYRRHFQGALVRSGASVVMWSFALAAFIANAIRLNHFVGITLSVIYLLLINPPTLLLLKHITQTHSYKYASLSINFLEILGYTAIIYFLGGIEATYLTSIYAAIITYVGVVAPRSFPFIIAAMCSVVFSFVVLGEYFGFLPVQYVLLSFDPPLVNQLAQLVVVIGLLLVVAYISSLTGGILKKSRDKLSEKNLELIEKTTSLEEAERGLRNVHQELEKRIKERTAELMEANDQLSAEIADRKRIEEALRESEEKYRSLVDHANDAIFIAQDGMVKFPNPSTLILTGFSEEDYATTPFVNLIHPEDREMVVERYNRRLRGDDVPSPYSFRIINKAGEEMWVHLNAVLTEWEKRPAVLCFIRDVTSHKKLEAQFQHAQKMEAVGTLAGGIAHDFNNLLQSVLGYTEILLMKDQVRQYASQDLEEIKRAAKRGAELTQQLLTFSRKIQSKLRPVDINQEVVQVPKILQRTLPKMIDVELSLDGALKPMNADLAQIEQILINLAVNARDAMPEGGKLTIETKNVVLDQEFCKNHLGLKPGDYVRLTVSDTGHGMDQETLKNIFDPFFTTKEVGKGTGLGLAMVYGIVKNHDGNIFCESTLNHGTTFKIYFPAARKDKIAEELGEAQEVRGGSETILLVDDEEPIRELGEQVLKKFGYTVLQASDGESAVKLYQEKKEEIDLVLLDLIMPVMGGKRCMDWLLQINPELKVIIASGYSPEETVKEILEGGAKNFINKPFNMKEMLQAVRKVLDEN
jgi:PAS domain S-box-containing protein